MRFDATSSNAAAGGTLTDYFWDFGDSSTDDEANSPTVVYTFPDARDYTVTLTVTDAVGLKSSTTTDVQVLPGPRVYVLPFGGVGNWRNPSMQPAYKPRTLDYGRSGYTSQLTWSGWGRPTASGHGIGHMWICTTSCAAGHFVVRRVVVLANLIHNCGLHYQYTGLREWYVGAPVNVPYFSKPGRPRHLYHQTTICGDTVRTGNQSYPYQP